MTPWVIRASAVYANCVAQSGRRLRHIGIGRTYAGTRVLLLIHDLDIRIIDAATGELLRQLVLDPSRNYQPTGQPPGPANPARRQNKHPGP